MLLSLVANPAPVSVEMVDIALITLPFMLGLVCFAAASHYRMYRIESNLLIAIMLYLGYLFFSMILGLLHGVPILNVLRSIGPYLNFFPLIMMGFLPSRFLNPVVLAIILISIGVLQAGYQLFLYFQHANVMHNTLDILKSRITLIEPRTTLPLILSLAVLPLSLLASRHYLLRFLAAGLITLGLFASAATLTRSVILSIMAGGFVYCILYFYILSRTKSILWIALMIKLMVYAALCALLLMLISLIPKIHLLEQGLLARFYNDSSLTATTDYTNGRLYDEWIPALNTWINSDLFTLLFGIGAGNSFIVTSGEERTYIHNLSIYSLVYGGVYGLLACFWLYFTIFKTLVLRAFQSNRIIYIGFASLLVSLFSYGQLFAVHKGLAFNAMLFLIMTIALCRPMNETV